MRTKKKYFLVIALAVLVTVGIFEMTEKAEACKCTGRTDAMILGVPICNINPVAQSCSNVTYSSINLCSTLTSAGSISVCLIDYLGAQNCGNATEISSKYCSESLCNTYVAGAIVEDVATNGATCRVTTLGKDTCSHTVEGKWDNSEKKCVECDTNNIETAVAGDNIITHVDSAGVGGPYFVSPAGVNKKDNEFESGCGADASCDEHVLDFVCATGKKCNASGACVANCNNNTTCEPGLGETTTNCPNDCCVNKTCADPAVCSDAVNCLTLEPACVGFCIAASAACDPDCGMWECDNAGFVEQCPTPNPPVLCSGLDTDPCIGGTYQNCDNGCTLNNAPVCWNGAGGCGVIPPGFCVDEYDACGCDCIAGGCNNDSVQNNGETGVDCGGGGCPACVCVPGALVCGVWPACAAGSQSRTCNDGCNNSTQTQNCCADDTECVGAPGGAICNTSVPNGRCVNCITNDDCAGTDVCDIANNACIPCVEEGVVPPVDDILLCCEGLNLWDKNFDGNPVCTSACDPNAHFYCNTLRDTVDTIVQSGEKMIGYILGLIGSVALLLVIIAGIMYMTAAGVEEKVTSAKKILTGAAIGLGIALLAFSLLQVIMGVLNM